MTQWLMFTGLGGVAAHHGLSAAKSGLHIDAPDLSHFDKFNEKNPLVHSDVFAKRAADITFTNIDALKDTGASITHLVSILVAESAQFSQLISLDRSMKKLGKYREAEAKIAEVVKKHILDTVSIANRKIDLAIDNFAIAVAAAAVSFIPIVGQAIGGAMNAAGGIYNAVQQGKISVDEAESQGRKQVGEQEAQTTRAVGDYYGESSGSWSGMSDTLIQILNYITSAQNKA